VPVDVLFQPCFDEGAFHLVSDALIAWFVKTPAWLSAIHRPFFTFEGSKTHIHSIYLSNRKIMPYICFFNSKTMKPDFRHFGQLLRARFEAFVWITGLTLMAVMSPVDAHASFCPLKNLGFSFCPGCGLGHAIAWLFRGDLVQSFHAHPLGIAAVLILTWRIVDIFRKPVLYY